MSIGYFPNTVLSVTRANGRPLLVSTDDGDNVLAFFRGYRSLVRYLKSRGDGGVADAKPTGGSELLGMLLQWPSMSRVVLDPVVGAESMDYWRSTWIIDQLRDAN